MANPSLQIGNSNWAIKEDDLLGYSTVGTNYLPKPMTMTRDSAGTRVDKDGLVNYAQIISGVEFIDNTNFATDTGWGGSYAINTVSQQLTKTSSGLAYQINGGIIAGTSYKIVVDVASLDGTTTVWVAGNNYNLSLGIQTIYAVGGTNSWNGGRIAINNGYASGAGSVLNSISVKEVTRNNLARVDYTDGTSSLLAEPERTNLFPYSEDFTNGAWSKQNATVALSSELSPDGTLNAYKVTATGTGQPRVEDAILVPAVNTTYTFSFFAKKGNTSFVAASRFSGSQYAIFNLDTGVVVSNNTDDASITALDNGWFKVSITQEVLSTDAYNLWKVNLTNGISPTTGVIGEYVHIYGAQLEEGAYGTSYIPTDGTTVTRLKDQYEKTGISDLINSEEGSFFVDIAALNQPPGAQISISLSGNGSNDRVLIYTGSGGGKWIAQFRKDGTIIVNVEKNTTITNQSKLAVSWKSGKYLMYIDGDKATTYSTGSETESDTFDAGDLKNLQLSPFYNASGNNFFGKVKQLQVYKEALSDSELETLTT